MRTTGLKGSPGRTVSDISRVESHSVEVFAAHKQVPFCGLFFVGALNIPNFYYSITLHLDLEYSHRPTTKGSPKKEGTSHRLGRWEPTAYTWVRQACRPEGGILGIQMAAYWQHWGGAGRREWETSNWGLKEQKEDGKITFTIMLGTDYIFNGLLITEKFLLKTRKRLELLTCTLFSFERLLRISNKYINMP